MAAENNPVDIVNALIAAKAEINQAQTLEGAIPLIGPCRSFSSRAKPAQRDLSSRALMVAFEDVADVLWPWGWSFARLLGYGEIVVLLMLTFLLKP
eukprot:5232243-Amphidinium_carterae.1